MCIVSCALRRQSVSRVLLLATTSVGKADEYRDLLADLPLRLVLPADLGLSLDVEETGATFRENADLKARAYARAAAGRADWTLAEDSGLEVMALGGEPGVYSARWGGTSDYAVKNRMLLERLDGASEAERGCRYVCPVTLVGPRGRERHCPRKVRGRLAREPRGGGGLWLRTRVLRAPPGPHPGPNLSPPPKRDPFRHPRSGRPLF